MKKYDRCNGLEMPKDAAVAHMERLIGDQRLVVGWGLGLALTSLGIDVTTVLEIDLATDPFVCPFFQHLGKEGGLAKDATKFIISKPELRLPTKVA